MSTSERETPEGIRVDVWEAPIGERDGLSLDREVEGSGQNGGVPGAWGKPLRDGPGWRGEVGEREEGRALEESTEVERCSHGVKKAAERDEAPGGGASRMVLVRSLASDDKLSEPRAVLFSRLEGSGERITRVAGGGGLGQRGETPEDPGNPWGGWVPWGPTGCGEEGARGTS
jgi:hypothetical protein